MTVDKALERELHLKAVTTIEEEEQVLQIGPLDKMTQTNP